MRKIVGTVSGTYEVNLNIEVFDSVTKIHVGTALNVDSNFEVLVDTENTCYVILQPDVGKMWIPNETWSLGDKCYPSTNVPYFYECIGSGQGGRIEPVFDSTPLGRFYDKKVIWRLVQRIPTPLIRFPVTPE